MDTICKGCTQEAACGHAEVQACGNFEGADSIVAVADKILYCIYRLSEVGTCAFSEDDGIGYCEYSGSGQPCYVMFGERLRALGVEV